MPSSEILVVTHNPALSIETATILDNVGYSVERVSTGEEGVQSILRNPPDIVIAEILMPGMDGFELLASIRRDPSTAHIPVLLLCAPRDKELADWEYRNPESLLLIPVSPERLLAAVRRYIRPR